MPFEGRGRIEFARTGPGEPTDIPGKFNAGGLHAEANAEVGNPVFPRVANGIEHPLDAAFAKAARYQNAVESGKLLLVLPVAGMLALQPFRFNPGDAQLQIVGQGPVYQGLFQRFVTVFVLYILAYDADGDLVAWVVAAVDQCSPPIQVRLRRFDVEGI